MKLSTYTRYFVEKSGFTLAEVLVTLAIIGVVAALTIPSLIQSTQKQQYVTGLKKAYSILSQASLQLKDDNGGTLVNIATGEDTLRDKYCTKLNCIKKCNIGVGADTGKCWHITNAWYDLDGGHDIAGDDGVWGTSRAILTDGTLVSFYLEPPDGSCTLDFGFGATICAEITVDINGFKQPNTLGRDIYNFWLTRDGLKPRGAAGTGEWWTASCTTALPPAYNGVTCAGRVLMEGDMNY